MGQIVDRRLGNGKRVFYARYYELGIRKLRATKQPTRKLATAWLADVEARIRRGDVGVIERTPEELKRATITVAELSKRFLGDVEGEAGYTRPSKIKSTAN